MQLIFPILADFKCHNMTNLQEKIMMEETWEDEARLELIMQCMKHDINTADGSGETILMKSSYARDLSIPILFVRLTIIITCV